MNKKQAGKKLLGKTCAESQQAFTNIAAAPGHCVLLCVLADSVGQYMPSCDEEGYYRSHQCHSSSGQCWCVDRYGNEVAGSRTHGPADCGRQNTKGGSGCRVSEIEWMQSDLLIGVFGGGSCFTGNRSTFNTT